jgi:diguanylate cyclase (GGDEF)-like protein
MFSDEPAHRRQMAHTAAALFGAAAVITVLGLVLPHQPQVDETGLAAVAAIAAVLGAALAACGERIRPWGMQAAFACGTGLVSLALLFNGERDGGKAGGDEMYYLWVALYAAYHFSRTATALHVALIGVAYAVTLWAIDPGPIATSRWLTTVGLAVGSVVVVIMLRERVERLLRELRRAAATDPLTGLLNRRAFEDRLTAELARAGRTGESFALVLADVDRLKELNDGHGHAAGDAALVALARALRGALRTEDTVARIGGDEFAILLPGSGAFAAHDVAARLVRRVRDDVVAPTISAGSAAYGVDGTTSDELMRAADAVLYAAKRRTEPRAGAAR